MICASGLKMKDSGVSAQLRSAGMVGGRSARRHGAARSTANAALCAAQTLFCRNDIAASPPFPAPAFLLPWPRARVTVWSYANSFQLDNLPALSRALRRPVDQDAFRG